MARPFGSFIATLEHSGLRTLLLTRTSILPVRFSFSAITSPAAHSITCQKMSLTSPLIDRDFATIEGERYSRAMLRFVFSLSLVASVILLVSAQSKPDWQKVQEEREACIASLSSFAVDPSIAKKPQFPDDFAGVALEFFSSGCYGSCPSFTMRIENNAEDTDLGRSTLPQI